MGKKGRAKKGRAKKCGGKKGRGKRKMTRAEKLAKKERQAKYQWIFMNGKQVRILRPQMIEGLDVDEFIARNADPIWLKQNEMWEELYEYELREAELWGDLEPPSNDPYDPENPPF